MGKVKTQRYRVRVASDLPDNSIVSVYTYVDAVNAVAALLDSIGSLPPRAHVYEIHVEEKPES